MEESFEKLKQLEGLLQRHEIEFPFILAREFAKEYIKAKKELSPEPFDSDSIMAAYTSGAKKAAIVLTNKIQRLEGQIEALQKEVYRLKADPDRNAPF
jgi:hypothetical protein